MALDLDTWENRRDSSSSRTSQLLTHASETWLTMPARRTTPYLLSGLPPDDEGKKAYLIAVSSHCGLLEEQTVALDHGHTEP